MDFVLGTKQVQARMEFSPQPTGSIPTLQTPFLYFGFSQALDPTAFPQPIPKQSVKTPLRSIQHSLTAGLKSHRGLYRPSVPGWPWSPSLLPWVLLYVDCLAHFQYCGTSQPRGTVPSPKILQSKERKDRWKVREGTSPVSRGQVRIGPIGTQYSM